MDNPQKKKKKKKKSQLKLAQYLSLSTKKTNNKHITTKESTEKQNIKRPMNNLTFMIIYDQCPLSNSCSQQHLRSLHLCLFQNKLLGLK